MVASKNNLHNMYSSSTTIELVLRRVLSARNSYSVLDRSYSGVLSSLTKVIILLGVLLPARSSQLPLLSTTTSSSRLGHVFSPVGGHVYSPVGGSTTSYGWVVPNKKSE